MPAPPTLTRWAGQFHPHKEPPLRITTTDNTTHIGTEGAVYEPDADGVFEVPDELGARFVEQGWTELELPVEPEPITDPDVLEAIAAAAAKKLEQAIAEAEAATAAAVDARAKADAEAAAEAEAAAKAEAEKAEAAAKKAPARKPAAK